MRCLLWPDTSFEKHLKELDDALRLGKSGSLPMAILVAEDDGGSLAGFLEVGTRSHADGCKPARPVGFVEGWFVHEAFRRRGVSRELVHAAEAWARAEGRGVTWLEWRACTAV